MLNFFIAMKDVLTNITLTDLIRAFGDNSMIYYNSDPEIIELFIGIFKNTSL